MKGKIAKMIILIVLIITTASEIIYADEDVTIKFKDKNLETALHKKYKWNQEFTIQKASELSEKSAGLVLRNTDIKNLEGLQYFKNVGTIYLGENAISDFRPLAGIKELMMLDISNNFVKGQTLSQSLQQMGKIENLDTLILNDNKITNLEFLKSIGSMKRYLELELSNNKIQDISILRTAKTLKSLDLQDNRIADVTPLKGLKKLTFYIDLRDNCILDFKPIKPLIDEMFSDPGNETGLERYDYYTNPVDIMYQGSKIKFPYLTAYYKYQAYAEAIPLLKALGGSANYNKKTGTLTCKYDGNVLVFKDFSKKYTFNGKEESLKYPMRRMQYDLAYVPVRDICDALGLSYNVTKERKIIHYEDYVYAPKLVEISKSEKKLG